MSELLGPPVLCPRCGLPLHQGVVKTAIWEQEQIYIVEDIPAMVCDRCKEQYYDDDTVDALRRLSEDGFPASELKEKVVVPVFSLTGRLPPVREIREEAKFRHHTF